MHIICQVFKYAYIYIRGNAGESKKFYLLTGTVYSQYQHTISYPDNFRFILIIPHFPLRLDIPR